jgi:thiol-disulfide isomerase/thioredoxin
MPVTVLLPFRKFMALAVVAAILNPVLSYGQEEADQSKADDPASQTAAVADDDSSKTPALTIGSQAPALDIEHWIEREASDDKPLRTFEKGKVYVVEFWATWCPPCIASMPHLAELQQEYKEKNVRIISISDEELEKVNEFLERKVPDTEDQTYRQLTSVYSLTTDPDQSVFNDYMVAAGQGGIPTAFVVGPTSQIEWIGHPMNIDPVLEQVVAGTWDRKAFAEQLAEEQKDQDAIAKASGLYREQEFKKAGKIISDRLAKSASAMSTIQLAGILFQISQSGELPNEDLAAATDKLARIAPDAEETLQPYMYDMRARMLEKLGRLDEAIVAEQEAIKRAEPSIRERMISYLDDLKAKVEQAKEADKVEQSDGDKDDADLK